MTLSFGQSLIGNLFLIRRKNELIALACEPPSTFIGTRNDFIDFYDFIPNI